MFMGIEVIRVPLVPRGQGGAARLVHNFLSSALFASLFGLFWCRGKSLTIVLRERWLLTG